MNPVAQRGLLITFEGSEGCGKSTQVAWLAARLRGLGFGVRELREPGGTALGEEIRHTLKHSPAGSGMTPEAELLLFNAARAQLVREVIRPALAAGEILLCDRFLDSTLAYQGWGRGLDRKLVETVLDITVGPTLPDLTLLLRVAPEISSARRRMRPPEKAGAEPAAADRFEAESRAFFERVEAGFAVLASENPRRMRVIDAGGTIEEVAGQVWQELQPLIAARLEDGQGGAAQDSRK